MVKKFWGFGNGIISIDLIHNSMARDLISDRWGSQKGHIETWHKVSQNG